MSQPPKPVPPGSPPWRAVNPPEWAKPVGYANAVVSKGGTRVSVAGQVAMGPDGLVRHPGDMVAQAALAFENVVTVLRHAGAAPEHLVRVRIFVVSVDHYRAKAREIGQAWRKHLGRWFPAMTLVQVVRLYDDQALIEVEAEAVLP